MVKTFCNICGKEFDEFDENNNFCISTFIGFGSEHDGDYLRLDICTDCMDKIIEGCSINPVEDWE